MLIIECLGAKCKTHTHTFDHRIHGYLVMSLVPWWVHIDEFEHNF
jgi:hypothetical protein